MNNKLLVNIFNQDQAQQTHHIEMNESNEPHRLSLRSYSQKVGIESSHGELYFQRSGVHLHISQTAQSLATPPVIMENFYEHLPQLIRSDAQGIETPYPVLIGGINSTVASLEKGQVAKSVPASSTLFSGALHDITPTIDSVYDDAGRIKDYLKPGETTDDARPLISGKAEPGSLVTIYANGIPWAYGYANDEGEYSITSTIALNNGDTTLTVSSSKDGQVTQGEIHFDFELLAPAEKPSINSAWDNVNVTGALANNAVTDDVRPELRGQAKPNSILEVFSDFNGLIGTVQVDENGYWEFEPQFDLAPGTQSFTVTQIGEGGPDITSNIFKLSIQPVSGITPVEPELPVEPVAPVITPIEPALPPVSPPVISKPVIYSAYDNAGIQRGTVMSGGTTDDDQPKFYGSGEPRSMLVVKVDGVIVGGAYVDAWGAWEFKPSAPLMFGKHQITVSTLDAQGKEINTSQEFELTLIDNPYLPRPPQMSTISEIVDDVGDVRGNISHGSITDDARPTISGTGLPGATLLLFDNGRLIAELKVGSDGKWSYTPPADLPLDAGEHSITSAQLDAQYEMSDMSPAIKFTVEPQPSQPEVPPVEPPVTPPEIVKPVIYCAYDNAGPQRGTVISGDTIDDYQPKFYGSGEPRSMVVLKVDGVIIGSASVDTWGAWEFKPSTPLTFGEHQITASTLDAKGNEINTSQDFELTLIDNPFLPRPPQMSTISEIVDDVGDVRGNISHGGITDDARPTFSGTGIAGATLFLFDNGRLIAELKVGNDGKWSYTPPADLPLEAGEHNITSAQLDAQYEMSNMSPAITFTVETQPSQPEIPPVEPPVEPPIMVNAPVITGLWDDEREIAIEEGERSLDKTPTVSGSADPFAMVYIASYGELLGSARADEDGNWMTEIDAQRFGGQIELMAIAVIDGFYSLPSEAWSVLLGQGAGSISYSSLFSDTSELLFVDSENGEIKETLSDDDLRLALSEKASTESGLVSDVSTTVNGLEDDYAHHTLL